MSVGQVLGGIVGGVIGWFAGGVYGAIQGAAIGAGIGSMLFPPPGPDGPRLQDLTAQASEYGKPIILAYGTVPVQGNVIWASDLVEQEHEEGGKGSGGESTVYTYFGNFAVGLVEAPPEGIAGVSRIWAGPDKRLIYDITPGNAGATIEGGIIRVYNGSTLQQPSALQESYEGVGNVPAYRGLAYVELEMFPLAKDHNTIPFLLCEVVMRGSTDVGEAVAFGESKSAAYDPVSGLIWTNPVAGHAQFNIGDNTYDNGAGGPGVPQIHFYDPIQRELKGYVDVRLQILHPGDPDERELYPSNGTMLYSGGWVFVGAGNAGDFTAPIEVGMAINGETKTVEYLNTYCIQNAFNNSFWWPTVPISLIDGNGVWMAGGNGLSFGLTFGYHPASVQEYGEPVYDPMPDRTGAVDRWTVPAGWTGKRPKNAMSCPIEPGETDWSQFTLPHWALRSYVLERPNAALVQCYGGKVVLLRVDPAVTAFDNTAPPGDALGELPHEDEIDTAAIIGDPVNECAWAFAGSTGHYDLYKVSLAGLVDQAYTLPDGHYVIGGDYDKGTGCLRLLTKISTVAYVLLFDPIEQEILETVPVNVNLTTYPDGIRFHTTACQVWNLEKYRCLIYNDVGVLWKIPYGNSLAGDSTTLEEVVTDLHLRAGLTEDQIDASDLTDTVDGYQIARQASVRASIDTLRPVYYFDTVESNGLVKYVKRGSASVVTIPDDDLGARLDTDSPVDPLSTTRIMENELPSAVNVTYQLKATDYDVATKFQRRLIGASGEQVSMQLPMVLSDEKAQEVADVNTYGPWAARLRYQFTLPPKYAYLEPTDVLTVKGHTMRLTTITDTPHRIRRCEAISEDVFSYSPNSITSITPDNDGTILDPVRTILHLLDVALFRDTDDAAGFYAAAAGVAAPWPSAILFKSSDGGSNYAQTAAISDEAVLGVTTDVLGDYQGNTFDELSTVNVRLNSGTIASATANAVLAGANVAVIGQEILQFKVATLESDGSYTLSGLLRGRRGAEWAASRHVAGDRFVLVTAATLVRVPGVTAELNLARLYKGVTAGATLASTADQSFTNTGAGLKPYAPVHIGGGRNGDDDLIITWTRRSRISGEWRDYVDVPLGETSEAYQVDVISSTGTVLRTLHSTSETVTYSAADQITDLGTAGGLRSVISYHIADITLSDSGEDPPSFILDPSTTWGWIGTSDVLKFEFFIRPPRVDAYSISEYPTSSFAVSIGACGPLAWTIDVSDDDVNWATVDTRSGEAAWSNGVLRTYTLAHPVNARYWRMTIISHEGSTYTGFRHFDLLSRSVAVNVFQMSSVVGRGYAGTADI